MKKMVDEAEHYKEKIESMQKYVQLLSKLIAQLQEKNDCTPDGIEKIRQLKILQQQLCDPKPGILLEELNKCEKVLENLFTLHENKPSNETPQTSALKIVKEQGEDEKKEPHKVQQKQNSNKGELKDDSTRLFKTNNKFVAEMSSTFTNDVQLEISEEIKENLQNTHQKPEALDKNATNGENFVFDLNCEKSSHSNQLEDGSKSQNATLYSENNQIMAKTDIAFLNTPKALEKTYVKSTENLANCSEEGNIEFFRGSYKDEDEKIILPDKECLFLKEKNELYDKNKRTYSEPQLPIVNTYFKTISKKIEKDPVTMQQNVEEETNCHNNQHGKNNDHTLKDNRVQNILQPIIAIKAVKTDNNKEVTKANTFYPDSGNKDILKPLKVNKKSQRSNDKEKLNEKLLQDKQQPVKTKYRPVNQNTHKRSNKDNVDPLKAKKPKISDSITISAEPEFSVDPLALDDENTVFSSKSSSCGHDNDNDTDDIEIIESRNSPILIDSDEDVKEVKTEVLKPKRPAFAFKSTNPNKIRDKSLKEKFQMPLAKKLISPQRSERRVTPIQQTNFLSNMDLQPNPPKSTDPRHFNTTVGQKTLQIPNAFYGSRNHEKLKNQVIKDQIISNSSKNACNAAHCRWLDNFLHHFCSSRNIVHNTSYLLLQQALRQDDYERIRRSRTEMASTEININKRLLCQLRNICYADGNHVMQKLTFVGRKLCEVAFVNILDKTISLTTDSLTNEVTSQTRISAATLDIARTEISKSKQLVTEEKTIENNLLYQNSQIGHDLKNTCNISPSLQNSSSLKKRREEDSEYCPPREINSSFTNIPPRRSLRNSARHQRKIENSEMITYTKNDDEEILALNEMNQQIQRKREKTPITADTEAYITQKRLAAKQEQQKKAKSFETAFIETISHHTNLQTSKNLKASLNLASNSVPSIKTINNGSEVFVISDDDDDLEAILTENNIEPRFYVIPKTSAANCTSFTSTSKIQQISKYKNEEKGANVKKDVVSSTIKTTLEVPNSSSGNYKAKNISPEVHSESKFRFYCLICSQTVTNAVAHYVNNHPEHEVLISRPSPKVAQDMLNNKLSQAVFDRLQMSRNLYIATCVFCQRKASFTLPYWYQHFASHTGEYAFKCTGCGVRKSTRSQLVEHVQKQCSQNGDIEVVQEYDLDLIKISAYTCKLCNYTQLSFKNVLNHLKKQHDMIGLEKCNIAKVTLLENPNSVFNRIQSNVATSTSQNTRFYVHGGDNEIFEIAEIDDAEDIADSNEQPVVINEAECEVNWNHDPSNL